jgi:iron complex transport system substrate-binding protein
MQRAVLWLLLALAAPVAQGQGSTLVQADGSKLALAQPAQRLVTLSPHLAELVYAAGAGDHLLATVEYSNYPQEAADLPRIGDAFRIDVERILAYRPDLVIAWQSGNPPAALQQLRDLGLAVWSVEIREPHAIADTVLQIGEAAGTPGQANRAADRFRQRLTALVERYQGAPRIRYFYQADRDPLFTLAGDHLVSKGLALCGGENIFAEVKGLAVQISHEAVMAADPEAILAPYIEGQPPPLAHWQNWSTMHAVQAGALYRLPADKVSRATPRWLDSMELACNLMHGSTEQRTP